MKPLIRAWEARPPMGGWRVSIDIKGQEFAFVGGPRRIVQQIASIQKRNNVYEGDQEIWDYCNDIWCERDPKRCLKGTNQDMGKSQNSIVSFGQSLLAYVENGGKPVDEKLANSRAKICSSCPQNRKVSKCYACLKRVAKITKLLIGKRRTPYDARLIQCGVCKCVLKQKVHFPLSDKDKNVYPDHCWVTTEKSADE